MGNKVTVVKGEVTEVFEDVIGHQIGNGAIQILERNGNHRIINNFCDVRVELDDEAAKNFAFEVEAMEKGVPTDDGEDVLTGTDMSEEDIVDEVDEQEDDVDDEAPEAVTKH